MSDLVKLLNESKNGYLSMCIRLLNLFEAENKRGGGGHSVVFFGLFCWFFFSLSYVASHTKLTAALEETSLLLSIYKLRRSQTLFRFNDIVLPS